MTSKNFSYVDFIRYKYVPRGIFDRLEDYTELLRKWQKAINLVGNATLNDIWRRHIIDSIQLFNYIGTQDSLIDIGSGAGFPGLVIAMVGDTNVTLLESDGRKVAFLKEAARITKTNVIILHERAEDTNLNDFSLIVARGFAPLAAMLDLLANALTSRHKLLLLKGKTYESEIKKAQGHWSFDYTAFPSVTDKSGVILSITNPRKLRAI